MHNVTRYYLVLRHIIFFTLLLFVYAESEAQTISTVAGTVISSVGIPGFSGDGGPASAAKLRQPTGLDVDSSGNIYIGDIANYRVRKINPAGIITTIAGSGASGFSGDGGPATLATFSGMYDLTIDATGNVFVTDFANFRVRRIDIAGIVTTVAGNGVPANTGDGGPATNAAVIPAGGIAVDKPGNLYIAVDGNIRMVNTAGIITSIAGTGIAGYSGDGGPATAAQIRATYLDVDRYGNIYMSEHGNYRIRKIDTFGIINTIAGTGVVGYSGDGGPATLAQVSVVNGVKVDDAGNVYISDLTNQRIRKVNTLGIITTFAGNGLPGYGGDGGPATAAHVNYLCRVAKCGPGNIYVADRNNHLIRMITDTNHAVTFTGPTSLLFNVCAPSVSIDSLLTATDADTGEVDHWNLFYGPFHGSVTPTYATYTTGGTILPTGLTYTPTPGYVGFDTFSVRVSDGYTSDSTTIYVRVDTTLPYAGGITGADSVCMGDTIMLADTVTGGAWSVTSAHASVSSGIVTGLTAGADTIRYIVTNACGADTATHAVYIKACPDAVPFIPASANALRVYPNPNDGIFTLSLSSKTNEPATIIITNVVGEKIAEYYTFTNTTTRLHLTAPPGIYFITASTGSGSWNGKMVKR